MRSIVVPATDEGPDAVIEFVEEELGQHDCPPKVLYQIQVAIEEIMVNIASYAGLADEDGVEVRCDVVEEPLRVVIQFLDRGVPFDPLAKADPDVTLGAEERAIGGLGIFLTKKTMDDVSYEYKDGRNILRLKKKI